jgi:hypothetical protein
MKRERNNRQDHRERYISLIAVCIARLLPATEPETKRLTEGNEGNEETSEGGLIFVPFVAFCSIPNRAFRVGARCAL